MGIERFAPARLWADGRSSNEQGDTTMSNPFDSNATERPTAVLKWSTKGTRQ